MNEEDEEFARIEREAAIKQPRPSYWFARSDDEGAGPTYVVGRGDEEITHPCLFRYEAQAIVDALNNAYTHKEKNNG